MTQLARLIHVNLPLFYCCYADPEVQWRAQEGFLTFVKPPPRPPSERLRRPTVWDSFDPWQKRDQFFSLKRDRPDALVSFLNTTGLFDRGYSQGSKIPLGFVWGLRDRAMRCLTEKAPPDWSEDFEVRLEGDKQGARVVFTTRTLMDAVMLSITTDLIRKLKVSKCARPDCAVPFTTTDLRKKFHSWYCGHIEAVRRERKKERRAKPKKEKRPR
jgi:hypothetical protein